MDDRDETEAREEVAEDVTPETNDEAVEQRTDDYDGIVRRLDDLARSLDARFDELSRMLEALGVAAVEGGNVDDDIDVATLAGAAAAETIDELLGIDGLDLL